jgi:hypothetical protein
MVSKTASSTAKTFGRIRDSFIDGFKRPASHFLQREESQRSFSSATSTISTKATSKKATTSSNSNRQDSRRRVRFEVDKRDNIKTHVHTYDCPADTDFSEVYTSAEELHWIRQEAFADAARYTAFYPEYVDSIEMLYKSPLRKATSRGSQLSMNEAAETHQSHPCNGRGLEGQISSLIHRHRKWATFSVLKCQSYAKAGAANACGESADIVLRQWCERVNKGPTEFALFLAQHDEKVAQEIYNERK